MKPGESVDNPATAKSLSYPDMIPILSGVTYTSDNKGVATVDSNGKITALSPGTANITVTIEDPYFNPLKCVVTVTGDGSQPTPSPTGSVVTPTPAPSDSTVTPAAAPTTAAAPTATPTPTTAPAAEAEIPAVGTQEKSKDGKASYEVNGTTKDDKGNTVAAVTFEKPEGNAAKSSTMTVPDQVVLADGTTAVVTEIAPKALYKNKKIKTLIIGKNVTKVGKNALRDCKNLKIIKIKSKKLTKKSFGKNCLKNI